MKEGTRAALRLVSVVALAGAALLAAAIVGLPICPTKLLFGVPCPGCGLTRAMIAIAKGDFGFGVCARRALEAGRRRLRTMRRRVRGFMEKVERGGTKAAPVRDPIVQRNTSCVDGKDPSS